MGTAGVSLDQIIATAKGRAEGAGVFESVRIEGG